MSDLAMAAKAVEITTTDLANETYSSIIESHQMLNRICSLIFGEDQPEADAPCAPGLAGTLRASRVAASELLTRLNGLYGRL